MLFGLVLLSLFVVVTGFVAITFAAKGLSKTMTCYVPTVLSCGVSAHLPPAVTTAINTSAITNLLNEILPLLIELAVIGAVFAAIGRLTRRF